MEERRYLMSTGNILIVTQDEDAESPDNWNNDECFLVYDHRDFCVERDGFDPEAINDYMQDEENVLYDKYHIFPVYAYIHSGTRLSLAHNGDRFDTSMKGFMLIRKEDADTTVTRNLEEAETIAKSIIRDWNTYLSGDIYKFKLIKEITCKECGHTTEEFIDSCGGFYGDNINTNGILDDIEGTIVKEL